MIGKHTRLVIIVLAAVVLAACQRPYYVCDNYNQQFVQCVKPGGDTLYYVTPGFPDEIIRARAYYEALGYTCTELKNYWGHYLSYDHLTNKKDIKYLESQGFICTEHQP